MGTKRSVDDGAQLELDALLDRMRAGTQTAAEPGTLNLDVRLRHALSEELRRLPLSRYQVAARMAELTGCDVTKSQLDSWTAESKDDHRFPAAFLPAFCLAVGSWGVLKLLAEAGGKRVFTDPHVDIAVQLGELEARVREREAALREDRRKLALAHKTWAGLRGSAAGTDGADEARPGHEPAGTGAAVRPLRRGHA